MHCIGIDVGGTFTDLVAVDAEGKVTFAKAPSTPADQSIGVMNGLQRLAEELGVALARLLNQTERIVHGTTAATNALLEGKGARVGLITSEGHRDILEMREGFKPDRYNLRMPAHDPLVARARRLGVRERIRADGSVETPLDETSLDRAVQKLASDKVEAVSVCFLHAYKDPRHEKAAANAVARTMPDAYVSISSEVLPQIKEYERVCTTVVNAYVGPILRNYLRRLEERLEAAGYRGPVLIMQSHGGVASIAEAIRLAAGAVLSGPAGGVAGGRYASKLLEEGNLIPFDMGGTSTDISVIMDGESQVATDREVGGHSVALPSLDIITLGAGGGSIARVDEGGIFRVGPESAGAEPGPACYGKGGTAPTVTDANLVLGYLDPDNFLAGRIRLDVAAAEKAVDGLAQKLGVSRVAAAMGVFRLVNTNMAEGIRLVSVRRGLDPRRFALLAFGGAAGLHVTALARQLEIDRVVVPRAAAVLSAWGMLATDLRHEVVQTHIGDASGLSVEQLRRVFRRIEDEGRRHLAGSFSGPVRVQRSVEMRYGEQIFEIRVPLDGLDLDQPDLIERIVDRFHQRHEELYTYSQRSHDVVLVNARSAVIGELPALPEEAELSSGAPAAPRTTRTVHLDRSTQVPIYDLESLSRSARIDGPAIVESATTTILLAGGDRATVTRHGWLDIEVTR
jgi:N-methylhydantoinase A